MPRIEGQRILLRDFMPGDVATIYDWANDSDITRFLIEGHPRTMKETELFVETQMSGTDPQNRAFAVARKEDLRCIGVTGCHNIDWCSRSAELGILIGKAENLGRGYGTEAIGLLLAFGFHDLNLHRVFLRVLDFNERALASYRRCGFIEEGRLREAYFRDGAYHDIIVMGILEEEYHTRPRSAANESE